MDFKSHRRAHRLTGFLLFGLGVVLTGSQAAQAKPSFSGEWKLNASKSEFSPMPVPEKRTDKIVHADPNLTVTTTQTSQAGEATFEQKYATDGTETTNELRGAPMKSTAKWDGDALMVTTKATFNGMDVTLSDKWTLSEDGKVLTIGRHIKASQGEFDQKIVLEKQ